MAERVLLTSAQMASFVARGYLRFDAPYRTRSTSSFSTRSVGRRSRAKVYER
jgi:hypothetical protein